MRKGSLPKPRALSRTRRDGTRYRVELLGDFHEYRFPALPTWWPTQENLTEPRVVIGHVMPVQVKVTGLGDVLVLTVDRVRISEQLSRFYCIRVEIMPRLKGGEISSVERLPLDSLVRDAVELAALECVAYPAGYEGGLFATAALGEMVHGATLKVARDTPYIEAVGWYRGRMSKTVREITSSGREPRANAHSPERDALVAEAWLTAARNGMPVEAAVEAALIAKGMRCSIHNVRALIKRVKALGLIPRTIQEVQK